MYAILKEHQQVPLTIKQLGAELYSLHRRKAVIILFPFRYGICEITSHMCPARAAFDIRQIVITLVSVGLQQYDFLLLSTAHNQTAWSRIVLPAPPEGCNHTLSLSVWHL